MGIRFMGGESVLPMTMRALQLEPRGSLRRAVRALPGPSIEFRLEGQAAETDRLLGRLQDEGPDLLLLDLDLPGGSGLALLRFVGQHHPDCKEEGVSELTALSDLEIEAFRLIGHGRSDHQIGAALQLSALAIETCRMRIRGKLGWTTGTLRRRAREWIGAPGAELSARREFAD